MTAGLSAMLTLWGAAVSVATTDESPNIDFAREVLPILSEKCFVCHGPDARAGQLRLDSYDAAILDRRGRRAIDPDQPARSELLVRIHSDEDPMPPAEALVQLTNAERDILTRWVNAGGIYATHWAFVPPHRPAEPSPPADLTAIIDREIRTGLQAQGIDFAPEADAPTLARRVALVLTGLPPEPAMLERFLASPDADGYAQLIDELLAQPTFGEHQARYWLDAVRYGDTHGLHLDNRRGIYPYRDWVVRAFNQNLPLDQFLTWQLAGDLLDRPTLAQQVATGFVRMNPSTAEGGAIEAEFQAKNSFDRVETLGTVVLGMSLTCARCHTHKYDPITQAEYYRLFAFVNNTAENAMDGNSYEYAPTLRAPSDQRGWEQWAALEAERNALLLVAEKELAAGDREAPAASAWGEASDSERLVLLAQESGPFTAFTVHEEAVDLAARIQALEASFTTTLVAKERVAPRDTRLLHRGEYDQPEGEVLRPDVPAVMGAFPKGAPRNRLGLAQWLTAPDHPLVARVWVNRLWQRVFGHGLVRSPEDFGLQGQQPTHPALLDTLSVALHNNGWNLKATLRAMVLSRTFRQSSARRPALDDPENRSWARGPSGRLDAEVLRDLALWASGQLSTERGGEGFKPYQPAGMWKALAHPASNTKEYERDQGHRLYRRSLYVYWKRTSPHPMMTLFDAPDRESSCIRRSNTSTPTQSLGLFNETQRVELSRCCAERLIRGADDDDTRLTNLFNLVICRAPSGAERKACSALLTQMLERYIPSPDEALELLAIGEAPRDESLDPAEVAAWTQVVITLLASDVALLLY